MTRVPWGDLTRTVLIPNLLHGSGQGAAIPVVPLVAMAVSGTPAVAAMAAAMLTVGQLLLALPAGWLVARFGERPAMLASTAVTGLGGLVAYLTASVPALVVGALLIGGGTAVFTMARHAWVTVAVPVAVRGRSLSVLAGSTRLGMAVGPFLAAAAFHWTGDARSGLLVVVATAGAVAVVVSLVPFPPVPSHVSTSDGDPRVLRTMRERRDVLLTLGLTASVIGTLRGTRRVLVPLVGAAVGFDEVTVALTVGAAAAVDFSLFYLGGVVTDRWGRLAVAVPTLLAFGLSHLGLAVALVGGPWWYLSSTLVMAVANGLSSGVIATMGSDLADPRSPAPFLGAWRLTTEVGPSLAPLAVAAIAGAVSLAVACGAFAVLACVGAALMPRYVRRFLS